LEPLEANPRIRSRKAGGLISMGEKREEQPALKDEMDIRALIERWAKAVSGRGF
jgi:anti-sigma-K factor RskA